MKYVVSVAPSGKMCYLHPDEDMDHVVFYDGTDRLVCQKCGAESHPVGYKPRKKSRINWPVVIFSVVVVFVVILMVNLTAEVNRRAEWCRSQNGTEVYVVKGHQMCVSQDGRILIPPPDSDGSWP